MFVRDHRRRQRQPYSGPVEISWTEASGRVKFLRARFIDLSETGLRVETSEPVPLRNCVHVRAVRIGFSGAASVKCVVRHGERFHLGLELSSALSPKTLAALEGLRGAPAK